MGKLKEVWNKLKCWQKGGIIGFFTEILFILLAFNVTLNEPIIIYILFNEIAFHPLDLATHIVQFYNCNTSGCLLNVIILGLVFYSFIGMGIGYLYHQLKR